MADERKDEKQGRGVPRSEDAEGQEAEQSEEDTEGHRIKFIRARPEDSDEDEGEDTERGEAGAHTGI